jgi:hypothetical protein
VEGVWRSTSSGSSSYNNVAHIVESHVTEITSRLTLKLLM